HRPPPPSVVVGTWGHSEQGKARGTGSFHSYRVRQTGGILTEKNAELWRRTRRSLDQAAQLLAEAAQHAALGDVDGPLADAELRRNDRGRTAGYCVFPAGFPGGRMELGLHDLQCPRDEVLLIFRILEHAGRVGRRLRSGQGHLAGADGPAAAAVAPLV